MTKKNPFIFILLQAILLLSAMPAAGQQIADSVYWVYFTDKENNGYRIDQPGEFLSPRSVERRAWQGLGIDVRDLPVTPVYLEQIRQLGVEIRHVSRWLNGFAMISADTALFETVLEKTFTDTIPWEPETGEYYDPPPPALPRFEPPADQAPSYAYGPSAAQVRMLNMDILHHMGYTGKGVLIGVMDAGFRNVDSLPSFVPMLQEGRVIGTRNYVNDSPVFRESSNHGMYVLSLMGADWEGNLMGTAPGASFLLCMTEDPDRETRIEEIAWIEAIEYADSLGVDVINSSLGYADFDGELYDYTYREMDGASSFISRAASLAASRGIIVCSSAGNEGEYESWYYITAPADARDILAAGAVDSTGLIGYFSSRGPTYDARIKPDVVTMGVASAVQSINGGVVRGSGTSFASPLLAGSVASLWQAYPGIPAEELIRWVRMSGNRSRNPDATYGFGIPDFARAYWNITSIPVRFEIGRMEIYPNPATDHILIKLPEATAGQHMLRFLDLSGRIIHMEEVSVPGEAALPPGLPDGIYILEIDTQRGIYRTRLIKM